jgi:hypothetical protein
MGVLEREEYIYEAAPLLKPIGKAWPGPGKVFLLASRWPDLLLSDNE